MKRLLIPIVVVGILSLLKGMIGGRDWCPPPPTAKKVSVITFKPWSALHLR